LRDRCEEQEAEISAEAASFISREVLKMKTLHSKARLLLFFATILLLVLVFPTTLHARSTKTQLNPISVTAQRPSEALQLWFPMSSRQRQSGERASLLLDEDIRVRAATLLVGDPAVKTSVRSAHVPLTILVITAPVILDV
jgi:hypothetical protein